MKNTIKKLSLVLVTLTLGLTLTGCLAKCADCGDKATMKVNGTHYCSLHGNIAKMFGY